MQVMFKQTSMLAVATISLFVSSLWLSLVCSNTKVLALAPVVENPGNGLSQDTTKTHKVLESLFTFDDGQIPKEIELLEAAGSIVDDGGSKALRVDMNSADHRFSGLRITPKTPCDWSQYEDFSLAFDIGNPGTVSAQIFLDVADADGASYSRSVSVPVGPARTYYGKLAGHDFEKPVDGKVNDLNFSSGLRSNPPTWDGYDDATFISMWGKKNLNLKSIKSITLSVHNALRNKEITIDNIRLIANPPMDTSFLTGIVDKFGQNAKSEFPGKIHNESELMAQRDAELSSLDEGKPLADRSKFSGWPQGPQLKATGFFRTEKVDGKWALVTPDGFLYFATGLDIIRLANSTTMTGYDFDPKLVKQRSADDTTPEDSEGLNTVPQEAVPSRHLVSKDRADMFQWLPSYDEPLGKHFGYRREAHSGPMARGEVYSFYSANLDRKYGQMGDYLDVWREVTVNRMLNWGFTSFGNWTDPSFYDNKRIPFFANGWIIGDFKTVSSGGDFSAPMPDVFDPVFEKRALATAKQVASEVNNSPWCVGVFIDNEKSWGRSETDQQRLGIVINTLGRNGKDVPTKAEFTRLMKSKYKEIDALNKAWGTNIKDWSEFDRGFDSKLRNDVQIADYSELLGAYAAKYFEVVDNALDQHMPNHMYLGCRFAHWGMPMEVVKASLKYLDVVSYNSYTEGLPDYQWEFLKELDKPSIIGEFHFGTTDSGLFHPGLLHTSGQEDRARMYKEYMESVIDNPYFVGAHWFQYMDSPLTGRAP